MDKITDKTLRNLFEKPAILDAPIDGGIAHVKLLNNGIVICDLSDAKMIQLNCAMEIVETMKTFTRISNFIVK